MAPDGAPQDAVDASMEMPHDEFSSQMNNVDAAGDGEEGPTTSTPSAAAAGVDAAAAAGTPDTEAASSADGETRGESGGAPAGAADLSSKFAATAGGSATKDGAAAAAANRPPLWRRPAFVAAVVVVVAIGAIVGGVVGNANGGSGSRSTSATTPGSNPAKPPVDTADDPNDDKSKDSESVSSEEEEEEDDDDPTTNPTSSPSTSRPTSSPSTSRPTASPSSSPSSDPSAVVSSSPSGTPTGAPTAGPTPAPTPAPTVKTSWETRDPPDDPPDGYFEYDPCEEDRRERRTAAEGRMGPEQERRTREAELAGDDATNADAEPRVLTHEEEEMTNDAQVGEGQDGGPAPPELAFVKEDDDIEPYSLDLCEGDCDDDENCQLGLICVEREGFEPVPGCSGLGEEGVDYCAWPEEGVRPAEEDQSPTQSPAPTTSSPTSLEDYCDGRGSGYGPPDWGSVSARSTPESLYWSEYSEWIEPSLTDNACEHDSKSDRQSPIDLTYDYATAECEEYHQIKDRKGDYVMDDSQNVKFEIHPTKLRIAYHWESEERDREDKDMVAGPSADVPKGWGDQLPVLHVDLKTPSEHTIEGRRFAAEYQIFLIQNHDRQRGAPAISVLFDLDPSDSDNAHLQKVLDMWQWRFDVDKRACDELNDEGDGVNGTTMRRRTSDAERPIMGGGAAGVNDDASSASAFLRRQQPTLPRDLQQTSRIWDPWDSTIFRSPWFFGYEGSLTEPPCTEFIEWRIIDVPAYMSSRQLTQIKSLLFDHVDPVPGAAGGGGCKPNTQYHREGVARPVQPLNGRKVHRCVCRDYLPKDDRVWYDRNRCWEGDEHVFHERVDGHWRSSPTTRPDRAADGIWNCDNTAGLGPPCCGRNYDPFHECCAEGTC